MKKSIGLLLAVSVVAVGLYASIASASPQSTKTVLVTVTMTDYHFKLSKTTGYKRGVAYTFKTINKGHAFHNFDIQGVKATKVITPGKTSSMIVTFKKAKKYQYICDVPRHAELGMAGFIKVT